MASLDFANPPAEALPSIVVGVPVPRQHFGVLEGEPSRLTSLEWKPAADWVGRTCVVSINGAAGWSCLRSLDIEAVFDRLEEMGLGSAPVAIVDVANRVMRCFVGGAESENELRTPLPKTKRAVTLSNLIDVIEEVRVEGLLTPQVCPSSIWTDQEAYVPGEHVERDIQWGVAMALRSSFRPVVVDSEKITSVGRIDINLVDPEPKPGCTIHPAVIELKALKSFTSSGNSYSPRSNLAAAMSGFRQTAAYKKKLKAALGLLACFDLRKAKDDILSDPKALKARSQYFDATLDAQLFPIYGVPGDAQEEFATC